MNELKFSKVVRDVVVEQHTEASVVEKLFWQYVKTEVDGAVYIKIPGPIEQQQILDEVAKANKLIEAEQQRELAKASLEQATSFGNMLDSLMSSNAVYVVPNKMTGRNLAIDGRYLEGKAKTERKQGEYIKEQKVILSGGSI